MKRLFVAIDFEPDASFLSLCEHLKRNMSKLDKTNWVQGDLFHITLKFLGETEDARIEKIIQQIQQCTSLTPSFDLSIGQLGIFGSRYAPRVLWTGIEKNATLEKVHKNIEKNLQTIGFKPYFGNFVPHITLARIHKIDDKKLFFAAIEKFQAQHFSTTKVCKILLYESILGKGFLPEYNIIHTFNLLNQ